MRYYHNGKQVTSTQAKEIALKGYYEQGYCCIAEFSDVWEGIHNEEEHRDTGEFSHLPVTPKKEWDRTIKKMRKHYKV